MLQDLIHLVMRRAQTVTILRATHDQMDQVLKHRADYETAFQHTVRVADTFTVMLPLFVDQVSSQLDEEEYSLQQLGQSLDQVGDLFPAYEQTATSMVRTGRLLAWLVATIVAVHGVYALIAAWGWQLR